VEGIAIDGFVPVALDDGQEVRAIGDSRRQLHDELRWMHAQHGERRFLELHRRRSVSEIDAANRQRFADTIGRGAVDDDLFVRLRVDGSGSTQGDRSCNDESLGQTGHHSLLPQRRAIDSPPVPYRAT
jgi:hypothetical protein